MEEIRIYRSIWGSVGLLIIGFLWIALSIYPLFIIIGSNRISVLEILNEFPSFLFNNNGVVLGSFILIVGGLGFLGAVYFYFRWAYLILKERIKHIPYYIITDRSFILRNQKLEICFDDVERFVFKKEKEGKRIEIQYKTGANLLKYERNDFVVRIIRCLIKNYDSTLKAISVDYLTIKPENLCDLLNERILNYESGLHR